MFVRSAMPISPDDYAAFMLFPAGSRAVFSAVVEAAGLK